jgi:hypothetical protein
MASLPAAFAAALAAAWALTAPRADAVPPAAGDAPALLWQASGFIAPESVVFDAAHQRFYVSNMGTWGHGATPGDGFISRLDADGRVLDLRWVTGFDSRRLSRVFRLRDGRFEPWAAVDAAKTGWPNGLLAERDRLLLGSWVVRGADVAERFGVLSAVTYADGSVTQVGTQRIGNIDGIEPDGRGGYTVTDWVTGDVLRVTAGGVPTRLMTLSQGAADHLYVADQRLLVVPLVRDHVVRAYRWDAAAR